MLLKVQIGKIFIKPSFNEYFPSDINQNESLRMIQIHPEYLESPSYDSLNLRIYLGSCKAIEQSYLISEMNWLRNQSMGRIGRLGRVTF